MSQLHHFLAELYLSASVRWGHAERVTRQSQWKGLLTKLWAGVSQDTIKGWRGAPGASNSNRPVTPLDLKKGRGREGEFLNPERPEALGEDLSLGAVALGREVRSVSDSSQLS